MKFCLSIKHQTLGRFLNWNSAHPPHVHTSWPKALRVRAKHLASNEQRYRDALQDLTMRFRRSFAPEDQVDLISDKPSPAPVRGKDVAAGGESPKSMWVSFGFHPALTKAVQRAIRNVGHCDYCQWLWKMAFCGC